MSENEKNWHIQQNHTESSRIAFKL